MPMSLITRLLEDEDEMSDAERREFHELEGSNEEAGRERLERDNERVSGTGYRPGSPLDIGRKREARLAQGLRDLGTEHNIQFAEPLQIDSRGEFKLVVDAPGFGPELVDLINAHRPRTGAQAMDPGYLLPTSTWCRMNHFDVEKMLRDVHITESGDNTPCRAGSGCAEDRNHIGPLNALGESAPSYDALIDRFDSLPEDVQKLVDFVAQVYNGGISQAIHNIGKECIDDVIPLLRMLGGKANEWALLLRNIEVEENNALTRYDDAGDEDDRHESPETEAAESWLYDDENAEAMLKLAADLPTDSLADSLLDEGGATPGYDIPMVLKVVLPGLKDKGVWYVEVKPPGKESGAWERLKAWAINRVAAAMLRSSGEEISGRGIVQLLREHPPTVKDVSNEDDGNWAARSRFIPIKKKQPAGF